MLGVSLCFSSVAMYAPCSIKQNMKTANKIAVLFLYVHSLLVGPTVLCEKFCQIPQASLPNSAAYRSKIVQIPWLATAFRL